MNNKILNIGVMDSGFGGLSVLNELINAIPSADYIYYGDLKNSPYGNKSSELVFEYCDEICKFFVSKNTDAILLACNTATSVSIEKLRRKFNVPIFGMEPAIKPAVLENPNVKIGVLATSLTLKEKKFLDLEKSLESITSLELIACDGLASLIDQKDFLSIEEYLKPIIYSLAEKNINTIVLGCTHYVLIKPIFHQLYPSIKIYDGNKGTASHIEKSLIPFPLVRESKLDLFINGGSEHDFEIAYSYLNNNLRNENNYVK